MLAPLSARRVSRRTRPVAVLFDLDGTLIDSIELILTSMRHAFSARGSSAPTDAEWLTGVGIPLRTAFRRFTDDDVEVDALIAAYREHQLAHHDRLVRCYDEVVNTVTELHRHGHPLAVVTSKSDWLAQRGLEHVGIDSLFATVVGCDSCARHKPDAEPVLTALERLKYETDESVFVGDSVHDIEAGNAAGVVTIAALWGPFSRAELLPARPTLLLERIADLPQVLAGI